MLKIHQLSVLTDNYIYLIHDTESQQTAVVDPALAQPVLEMLQEKSWSLDYIYNTHHHADHVGGNSILKAQTGCKIIGAKVDAERIPDIDITVVEGDELQLGEHKIQVLETYGHTLGHISFYFPKQAFLFCGDTLFAMGCGRLFEGTAEQMWQSLSKLKALNSETQCYCAHEYTAANGAFALTIEAENQALKNRMQQVTQQRSQGLATVPFSLKEELATNPFLRADLKELKIAMGLENYPDVEVFAEIRRRKDSF